MHLYLTLLLAVSVIAGCTSSSAHREAQGVEKSPAIEMQSFLIQPEFLDLGEVMEGEEVSARLFVRNTGLLPLRIAEVHAACGCTVASVAGREVPPGGFTTLDVTVDTTAKGDDVRKKITVIDLMGHKAEAWLSMRVKEKPHAGEIAGRGIFNGTCASCHVEPARGKVKGVDIYTAVCAMCHGTEGQGAYAPALRGKDADGIQAVLQHGINRQMPAFVREKGGPLTQKQLIEVATWLSGLDVQR